MDARSVSILAGALLALALPMRAADPDPESPRPQPQPATTNPSMSLSSPKLPVTDACRGFDGTWADNWGTTITMSAGKGTYDFQGIHCTIEGKVDGRKLTGVYVQPKYPDPIFERGTFEFELAADGKSWKGRSWDKDGNHEMGWEAECVGPYVPPSTPTKPPKPRRASLT